MASPSLSFLSSASEEEQSCAAQHGEMIVNTWTIADEVVQPGDRIHPLRRLRNLLNNQFWDELGNMDVSAPQEADPIMDNLIVLLDPLFFQGELLPVRFEWSNVLGNGVRGDCGYDGAGDVVIRVNPSPASAPAGNRRAMSILSTLLHECVHAVFWHHCRDSRPPHDFHDNDCADDIGWTGHGPAWRDLAREVEARARRIIGDRVDLGIATSLQLEQAYQTNTLSQQQAQALGLQS